MKPWKTYTPDELDVALTLHNKSLIYNIVIPVAIFTMGLGVTIGITFISPELHQLQSLTTKQALEIKRLKSIEEHHAKRK